MAKKRNKSKIFEHQVAISYASEDRKIAGYIAELLRSKGVSVFYDKFYKSELWGKKLSTWFKKKFGKSSRFVLVLVSRYYPVKDWTDFEFSIAAAEEKKRKDEFILPVRLDDTKLPGLPSDKVYLDLKKEGLEEVVNCLVQKVKTAVSDETPEQFFREAYEEWKINGFLPGETKVTYFLEHLSEIRLNVDTCEFLLRSLTGDHPNLQEKIKVINKEIIFSAATRLLDKRNENYTRWRGITYLVFANPGKAEPYLWNLYRHENEDLSLRVDAFKQLWKCESRQGIDESYSIALKEPKWQFRQAALVNIGHGNVRKETLNVLAEALRDRRWEVRTQSAYAIVRFELDDLVPNLVTAFENERSRKGANRLLYCLRNFKNHPSVKQFRKKHELPKSFDKTPDYHAVGQDIMDEMV